MEKIYAQQETTKYAHDFFVVTVGDNFYGYGVKNTTDPIWKTDYVEPFFGVRCPWYPVLGNHDWQGNIQAQIDYQGDYFWRMESLYYTKVINNIEFFFLDTPTLCPYYSTYNVGPKPQGEFKQIDADVQLAWLESVLKKSTSQWRIAVGHYPIISAGVYKKNKEMKIVEALLLKYKVDMYFCGHDHNLQHLYNPVTTGHIHHFLSGSGSGASSEHYPVHPIANLSIWSKEATGFMNVIVQGNEMTVKVIDWEGDMLYTTKLNSRVRHEVPRSRQPLLGEQPLIEA